MLEYLGWPRVINIKHNPRKKVRYYKSLGNPGDWERDLILAPRRGIRLPALQCLTHSVCLEISPEPGVKPAIRFLLVVMLRLPRSTQVCVRRPSRYSGIPMSATWVLHRLHMLDPCSLDFLRRSSYLVYS